MDTTFDDVTSSNELLGGWDGVKLVEFPVVKRVTRHGVKSREGGAVATSVAASA